MNTPNQALCATPVNGAQGFTASAGLKEGTVVFLKEAGADNAEPDSSAFVPLFHHRSITLRDLAEEYNISSVLECDANGTVQPRAVAYDSPSDILHSGHHYIARRDAKAGDGINRVTFRGKILVKEYDLDHHSTPSQSLSFSAGKLAPDTPFFAHRVCSHPREKSRETETEAEWECSARCETLEDSQLGTGFSTAEGGVDATGASKENQATSGLKRLREGDGEEVNLVVGEVPFVDLTNRVNLPAVSLAKLATPSASTQLAVAAPANNKPQLRYLPFSADLDGTGTEVTVRLEDLAALCRNVDELEQQNAKRHEEAEELFASARRVLFTTSKQ